MIYYGGTISINYQARLCEPSGGFRLAVATLQRSEGGE